ncbi:hypothetical protein BAZ12_19565 [Elizabethkingia miricola]|jgi:hypothetical protein|uniref:HEAT repeat domain-containing protein n=1 Tax=Elizabethkingia miricola TaxID=172045 RepID=A0ABD4DQE3_ELIMR|nr:hypothetical protein [Elizabethkingia miricola]KUY20851.1 hypothetical protein ATB95_08115 [Elizabethkingia miricola]MCL1652936.1 hypothetical protein [Elizabethkingia miricola]OPC76210.1 hypothetical protein BAZ12_19565 [Elizabethkingia miricola]SPW34224.1 Uncharacterised protein [Elizabethkingia miricola]
MASKKQLKEYARNLEALLLVNSETLGNTASLVNILSDNVSLEVKLQTVKTLARVKLTEEDIGVLRTYRRSLSNQIEKPVL